MQAHAEGAGLGGGLEGGAQIGASWFEGRAKSALLTMRGYARWADDGRTSAPSAAAHQPGPTARPMKNDQILSQISEFCRQADMAESTFGRRAVNDGKLVHRLREGKRITIRTRDRIQT